MKNVLQQIGKGIWTGVGIVIALAIVGGLLLGAFSIRTALIPKSAPLATGCSPNPCVVDDGIGLRIVGVNWHPKVKQQSTDFSRPPQEVDTGRLVAVDLQLTNFGLATHEVHPYDFRFRDIHAVERGPVADSSIVSLGEGMESVGIAEHGSYGGVWLYFATPAGRHQGALIWNPQFGRIRVLPMSGV